MPEARFFRTLVVFLGCALVLAGWLLVTPAVPVSAATQHVTDCGDAGANTLRGQIAAAAAGDSIVFDQDCTITLATGTLRLTKNVTIDGTGHTVIVDGGCTFKGTTCTSGGVTVFTVNSGVTASLNTLTIQHGTDSIFEAAGGGISNGGTLTLANSTVRNNSSNGNGGGISNGGTLTVMNSTVSGNSASSDGDGGGIYNVNTLTVTNSTLAGNNAQNGGGISSGGTLTVTNSTLSANNASFGGGILNLGTLTVTNSTLAGNSARNIGGGIENGGTVPVTNDPFPAFARQCSSTLTVTNTIVAGNSAGTGTDLIGTFTTGGHNLIGMTGGATITLGAGDLVNPTPLLGTLGSNGGPTPTIPPLPGSPAIAAGDDTVCASTTTPAAAPVGGTDQRGITRPQGAHCDIGAVES